jgi:hypothetical protein
MTKIISEFLELLHLCPLTAGFHYFLVVSSVFVNPNSPQEYYYPKASITPSMVRLTLSSYSTHNMFVSLVFFGGCLPICFDVLVHSYYIFTNNSGICNRDEPNMSCSLICD